MGTTLLEDILGKLDILAVKDLLPHEQTVPPNVKRLKEAMLNIGQLVDPIIVDKKHKVVLDGNHRLNVLQIIECPQATCQVVDYDDPKIEVGTWYLAINKPLQEVVPKEVKVETVDFGAGKAALFGSKAAAMAVSKNKGGKNASFIAPGNYKMTELIEVQNSILGSMKNDTEVRYIADDQADEYLEKGYTVLFRRPFSKEEIIKAAEQHTPFPPKSTRHLIPNRIIRLNMRLGWLHEDKQAAHRYLRQMLENRVYNGNVRRYVEPVIVIY